MQGLSFGSAAIIVMNETVDTLDILRRILEFFRHESCGKCTPCREGLVQTQILLDRFIDGKAEQKDLDLSGSFDRHNKHFINLRAGSGGADLDKNGAQVFQ